LVFVSISFSTTLDFFGINIAAKPNRIATIITDRVIPMTEASISSFSLTSLYYDNPYEYFKPSNSKLSSFVSKKSSPGVINDNSS